MKKSRKAQQRHAPAWLIKEIELAAEAQDSGLSRTRSVLRAIEKAAKNAR